MKNLMKRALVLVTAATMLLGSFPQVSGAQEALSPNAYGLYPTAAYSAVSAELDDTGAWKYRELVPDLECETLDNFTSKGSNTSGSDTQENTKLNEDAYRGNYSLSRKTRASAGIGFRIPYMQSGGIYVFSAWMKGECNGADLVKASPARNYTTTAGGATEAPFEKASGTGNTQFNLTDSWEYYSADIKAPSDISTTNSVHVYLASTMDSGYKDNTGKYVQNIFIDEWSLRMAIPTNSPASYVKSISPSPEKPAIKNGEDLTFKFSLDIDPRTVRKENITVNGTKNSPLVKAVKVTTAEATRETTLTISFNTLEEGTAYTVALPEIKDAWGRDVVGTTTASITCVPADAEYTIYEDLDESGAWKYRNLVPDEECESLEGFVSKGSSTVGSTVQTNIELSDDKHSGSYSIKRATRKLAGIGFKVDSIEIDPAEYYVSAWIKSDCDGEGCQNVPVDFARNYNYNGTGKETSFDGGNKKFLATTEWKYFSKTVKQTEKPDSDKQVTIYFSNADTTNGIVDGTTLVQTIYVDDWNFRLVPSWSVNATSVNVNGNTAIFTFDKDIDKWTVTADKLLVNGEINNNTITSAVVATDELTRVTTLTVTATENIDDDFVISLPDKARDAWGREIAGIKSTGLFYEEKITDASGTIVEVTDMTAGTRNYVINNIANNTSKEINMTAIIALYNADKTLESVNLNGVQLAPGQKAEELKASVTIPELHEGMSVKCFLWNMDTLCPFK